MIAYTNPIEDQLGPITGDFNLRAFEITHDEANRDIYTKTCEKLGAKKFVADIVGNKYVVPTYRVGDSIERVVEKTRRDKYMLKYNLYSNANTVVENGKFLTGEAINKFSNPDRPADEYYYWWKDKQGKFYSEQYLDNVHNYKFFCYKGEIMCLYSTVYHRDVRQMVTYPDLKPVEWTTAIGGNEGKFTRRPDIRWNEMVEVVKELAKSFPLIRIDMMSSDGRVYFGEFTPTFGGFYAHESCQKPIAKMMEAIDDRQPAAD